MSKKPVFLIMVGALIGAVVISIVGFSMDWVVTTGRARVDTVEASSAAVKNQLVPICVHQFNSQADHAGNLMKLKELKEWKREAYISKGGWAVMPGSDSTVSGVARLCAMRLVKVES